MSTLPPINFTVIGGFLGAGKTNLVNRILSSDTSIRFAVMVNDFGALNIDESLITETQGQIMQLANGCICCSLAGGLVEAMINLMNYRHEIDHILIEASGVSNPSRIMDFARIDKDLHPGSTLVLADATRLANQLADPRLQDTLHDQLSSADIFLLTKTDISTEEEISQVKSILNHHQPHVPIVTLLPHDTDLAKLLVLDDDKDIVSHQAHNHDHDHTHDHGHDHMEDFISMAFVTNQPIAQMAFVRVCKTFSHIILRGKGVIHFKEGLMVWHQTGRNIDFSPYQDSTEVPQQDDSRMIIISTEQLGEVSQALQALGFTSYNDALA